jgi:hypothetical protein
MARRKRSSDSITRADNRYAGLVSIDANLDLGNGLTLAAYKTAAADTKAALDTYNSKLSELDSLLNGLEARETALDELSVRMLAAVGVKYGKDSNEYEQAGGTRSSERKAPERKAKAPALVPA